MNQRFNLRQALNEIVLSYNLNIQNTAISFKLKVQKQTPKEIICDKSRLQQIISNLLSNAIKYARSRIYIEVEYRQKKSLLQVIVTDDGIGFAIDKMRYIVDFMSVTPEFKQRLPKTDGVGMGLYISKAIIAKLGGKIQINTAINAPTSFKIQIPSQLP